MSQTSTRSFDTPTDAPTSVEPFIPGVTNSAKHPGLRASLDTLATELSVAAATTITVTCTHMELLPAGKFSSESHLWYGTRNGGIVGLEPAGTSALAASLMGQPAIPEVRRPSKIEDALLTESVLPLFNTLVGVLAGEDHRPVDYSAKTNDSLFGAVGEDTVLTAATFTMSLPTPASDTPETLCEIRVGVPMHPVLKEGSGYRPTLTDNTNPLGGIVVNAVCRTPPTKVTLLELATLQVGDTLQLAPLLADGLQLWVDDHLVGLGEDGTVPGRKGIQITTSWREHIMNDQTMQSSLDAAQFAADGAGTDQVRPTSTPDLDFLGTLTMNVAVEMGRCELPLSAIASLAPGQLIELDKSPQAPSLLTADGNPIAKCELMVIDGRIAAKILEKVSPR